MPASASAVSATTATSAGASGARGHGSSRSVSAPRPKQSSTSSAYSTPRPGANAAGTSTAAGVHSSASPPDARRPRAGPAAPQRQRREHQQRPGAEQAEQRRQPPAVDHEQARFERAQVGAVEGAVQLDRLAAHLVGNAPAEVAEDRRREIDRGDQAALVGALRAERMPAAEPADGHPQQFVAGRVGRALHDDLELARRAARRSERAGRSTRLRPPGGRPRPVACACSTRRCAPAASPPSRATAPRCGRRGRPPRPRPGRSAPAIPA